MSRTERLNPIPNKLNAMGGGKELVEVVLADHFKSDAC